MIGFMNLLLDLTKEPPRSNKKQNDLRTNNNIQKHNDYRSNSGNVSKEEEI